MSTSERPTTNHPFAGAPGVLAHVGITPLVRIQRTLPAHWPADVEIWAKLEGRNPGGSVKDRAALAMILAARREGRLRPGQRLLDSSSGNTGIAEAMIGAILGHPLTLCLPAHANPERKRLLRAYGADVVETDPIDGSDGALRMARAMAAADPSLHYLDQYSNDWNWRAHAETTGPEIWAQSKGGITHFVAGLGTTGTFVGTSRFLLDAAPHVQRVAVQPDSPFHGIEGLKFLETSMVPEIWDPSLVHVFAHVETEAGLGFVPRLAREEGLLVGPSSGAALKAALDVGATLTTGRIVVIFPDGGERYLSDGALFAGA